jgi:hypothetical protein
MPNQSVFTIVLSCNYIDAYVTLFYKVLITEYALWLDERLTSCIPGRTGLECYGAAVLHVPIVLWGSHPFFLPILLRDDKKEDSIESIFFLFLVSTEMSLFEF